MWAACMALRSEALPLQLQLLSWVFCPSSGYDGWDFACHAALCCFPWVSDCHCGMPQHHSHNQGKSVWLDNPSQWVRSSLQAMFDTLDQAITEYREGSDASSYVVSDVGSSLM